jgi:subtilase family protein/putative Ig domain-containing protein
MPRAGIPLALGALFFMQGLPVARVGGAAPDERFGREGTVKIRVAKSIAASESLPPEVRVVAEYDSFVLVEAPQSAATNWDEAHILTHENFLLLSAGPIDTSQSAARQLQRRRGEFPGRRLHLLQFAGPVRPAWYADLERSGARIVAYIPSNSYLVYGTAEQLAAIQAFADVSPHVQWNAEYIDDYKVHSGALPHNVALTTPPGVNKLYALQLVTDPTTNPDTLAVVDRIRSAPVRHQYEFLGYQNIVVELPPEAVFDIARQPDVVSIQLFEIPTKNCERQNQIIAGNLAGTAPSGPGYLSWLLSHGFTQAQFDASNFSVDVSDSGIDNATTSPNHFGLHVAGLLMNASRVNYARLVGTPNPGSTLQGCDGHGTLDAHIIAGYSDRVGFPFQDAAGFRYGLGVCPFVDVGSSVIFDPDTFTFPNYAGIQSQAYASGARISCNSWGADVAGVYTSIAQTYDGLVRDAQPTGSPVPAAGNQEMVIVVASGNAGSGAQTVGTPATGKNVITVGAAENVQLMGGFDLCGWPDSAANNANEIAVYSSRGPCADGRKKPDLVAPGTRVSGGVAQAPNPGPLGTANSCFDGGGICGGLGSVFFPGGQQFYTASTGTSHSCPAVAGGCALVRQFFINEGMAPPTPAMTKALLMNTARYLNGAGAGGNLWSNSQGMGELNLGEALNRGAATPTIFHDQDAVNRLFTASGQSHSISSDVADVTKPLRVTLAWTDAPGSTIGAAYRNDLDLSVILGGNTYLGNVFTSANSTLGGSPDTQNNVESVFLPAGVSGALTVVVTAANINSDGVPDLGTATDQDYALVVYNVSNCAQLAISSSNPPDALLAHDYSHTLAATGGAPPIVWSLVSGALPSGLVLSDAGIISGRPTSSGDFAFMVKAADTLGCTQMRGFTLRVNCGATGQPTITKGPVNRLVCLGGTASFSVSATSLTPLNYQWRKDGQAIGGATHSSLQIVGAGESDVGWYDVVVYSECSQVASQGALLSIDRPIIAGNPGQLIVPPCKTVTFSVQPGSLPPYTYQWRRDGVHLVDDDRYHGSQSATLSVGPVARTDSGAYDVVVGTSCGDILSDGAVLVVEGNAGAGDCPQRTSGDVSGAPCAQGVPIMGVASIFSIAGWGAWRRRRHRLDTSSRAGF